MKDVIIVGATGATGSQLMAHLLTDASINKIYSLHYRATQFQQHTKVTEIVMDLGDFNNFTLTERIPATAAANIGSAYCCLGTTRKKAGSQQAFRRVDKDYVVNFGRWVAANTPAQLHVISAVGANAKSPSSYLQTKGETEQLLQQLPLTALCLYQPTLLYGNRAEFRLLEALAYYPLRCLAMIPLDACRRQQPIAIKQLANAMYQLSKQVSSGSHIISSLDIQAY